MRAVALLAGHEPGVQVRRREQGVVVQHLLEVRHEPPVVDRVAVEAASEQVVHPAGCHPVERLDHHRAARVVAAAEQELEHRGVRELRRAAPAAERRLERRARRTRSPSEELVRQRLERRAQRRRLTDRLDELSGRARHVVAPLAPGLGDRLEHLPEARQPVPRFRRVVGAAVERLAGRRQEDGHRPPAVAGHRDDRLHVDRVEVGTLFAIDLHAHVVLVHHGRGGRVLERLVLHHVAPVARRVADREEDRPVLLARPGQCLVAPRVPVDRVGCVLQEVRACLAGESVHATELATRPHTRVYVLPPERHRHVRLQ